MGPSQEIKDAKAKKKKKQGELDIDEGDSATVPKRSAGRRGRSTKPKTKRRFERSKKITRRRK
tara:strand:- start:300 stop:488 length:189 start_codon:yes stop_codon:yes gene_type:complete